MTTKRKKATAPKPANADVLFGAVDRQRLMDRFGALPGTSARQLLVPPPSPTEGHEPTEVMAHNFWYETWKAMRRKGIGASEVATVAGVPGAYGSPFALWWEKTAGLEVEQDTDGILVMGTRMEEIIGGEWAERNPEAMLVRPGSGLYGHPTIPWLMATPDFLAVSKVDSDPWPHVEPVECKAYDGGKGWGKPGTDDVPSHIEIQGMAQCDVLGATRFHVARMKSKRITTYSVDATEPERVARYQAALKKADAFWQSLEGGTPPPIDGSDATESVLAFQFADVIEDAEVSLSADLVERYRWALSHANEAKRNLALVRNQVRAAMGTAEFAVDAQGEKVAARRVYKRHEYTVPSGVVDGVWPIGVQP